MSALETSVNFAKYWNLKVYVSLSPLIMRMLDVNLTMRKYH